MLLQACAHSAHWAKFCHGAGMLRMPFTKAFICASIPDTSLSMNGLMMAEQVALLALPDALLENVASMTRKDTDWVRAAMTCKKLWELRTPSCPPLKSWKSEPSPALHTYLMCMKCQYRC